jgi:hypothetical protein
MSVSISPLLTANNEFKQLFNINDWKSTKEGYVTFSDLENYAHLSLGNTFIGALNVFKSIGFTNQINNVDAQTLNYLKNVTSDIQEQFFDVYDYTIQQLALKRNLTNNVFNGDVFLKSSNNAYGYTIKPSYDSNQNRIDDNTISMLGYNSLILKSNLSCSILSCNQATIGGGSQLSRIRRNLNIDNVLRVGYNDATDRGANLSNNARVDINGSIFVKDNILLNGLNLKTYIDAQDATLRNDINLINTNNDFAKMKNDIIALENTRATIIYVDDQIAGVYNTSNQILSTIQAIQTELSNDNATEVVLFNEIGKKLNITDFNNEKALLETAIDNIENQIVNYENEIDTNTVKIRSDLNVQDMLITNNVRCNEIVVNKIVAHEIVSTQKPPIIIKAYLFANNKTYPIIKKTGFFVDFNLQSILNMEITLFPKYIFSVYDENSRIVSKITNSTDDFLYYQSITIPPNIIPHKFSLRPIF